MRKYFCLLLCLASFLTVMAQEKRELKNVQLKSGITVTGYVTNNTDGSVSVTTTDGDQLLYQAAEVKSVNSLEKQEEQSKHDDTTMKERRFLLNIEALYGYGPLWKSFYSIIIAPCYHLNDYFLIGIGVGWTYDQHYYGHGLYSTNSPIVEAITRYNVMKKPSTPYLGFNVGIGCNGAVNNIYGGELGFIFRNNHGGGPFLGLFYDYYKRGAVDQKNATIIDGGILGLNVGWTF